MRWPTITLGSLLSDRAKTLNPAGFPDETFSLYSIPGYDRGQPEVLRGDQIGSSKQILYPGDVLLSKIVPHIRRSWVVEAESNPKRQIGSGEWIVFRSDLVDSKYLSKALVSDEFHRAFMRTVAGVGGSLLRARPTAVAEIRIPLPPLDEQKRIAAVLDKADALRRQRQESLQLTEKLLQSVFLDMFGDPVTNSKNLPTEYLSELAKMERGRFSPRPRNDPTYFGGQHPFIQTGDITRSKGRITSWTQTLNDKGAAVSKEFRPGTVVIAIVGATIGETAIVETPVYCPDSIIGISPNENKATPEFIEFLLRLWKPRLREQAPDAARANLNLERLRPLRTLAPRLEHQQEFTRIARLLRSLVLDKNQSLSVIDNLFSSLQQRAFRGELDLSRLAICEIDSSLAPTFEIGVAPGLGREAERRADEEAQARAEHEAEFGPEIDHDREIELQLEREQEAERRADEEAQARAEHEAEFGSEVDHDREIELQLEREQEDERRADEEAQARAEHEAEFGPEIDPDRELELQIEQKAACRDKDNIGVAPEFDSRDRTTLQQVRKNDADGKVGVKRRVYIRPGTIIASPEIETQMLALEKTLSCSSGGSIPWSEDYFKYRTLSQLLEPPFSFREIWKAVRDDMASAKYERVKAKLFEYVELGLIEQQFNENSKEIVFRPKS